MPVDDFTPIGNPTPVRRPGILETLGHAVFDPAINYGRMVGAGASYAGRLLTSPSFREITQKVNANQPLTEQEAAQVLANPTPRLFGQEMMTIPEAQKFRDIKSGLWEGTKRTAGMEAYLAPALVAPAAGGGLMYAGGNIGYNAAGQGALRALASGAGAGIAQKAGIGAVRGAIGGGLLGYAGTKENTVPEALKGTAIGAGLGSAIGAGMGALSGAAEKPVAAIKEKAGQFLESKIGQPVSRWASGTFARIFQVSKNKGTRDIDTDFIAQHWMDDRMPIPKNMQNVQEVANAVNQPLGEVVNQAAQAYDDQRIPYTSIYDAAKKEMANKIGFDKPVIDEFIRTLQTVDQQAQSNANVVGAVQKLGLPEEVAQKAIDVVNAIDPAKYLGPEDVNTGMAMRDPRKVYDVATQALVDSGMFDPDTAKQVVITAMQETAKKADVGSVTPLQALEMKRTIGDNLGAWKRNWLQSKDPKAEVYYKAYQAAYRTLGDLLDEYTKDLPANNVLMYVPDANGVTPFQKLAKLSPEFAQRMVDEPTIGNWIKSMAPYVQAGQAARETIGQQSRILQQVIARGGASALGGVGGAILSGGNPLVVGAGAIFGPIVEPIGATIAENVRVPLTAATAKGIHAIATGAVPAAIMRGGAGLIQGLANAATTAPAITGATQFVNWLGKDKSAPEPTINQPQDDFEPLQ